MEISATPELITPRQALQWLNSNGGNRKLSPSHVRFLADQIRDGQWQVTPDTIKLSESGRLLDGQHRLSAIVEADKPQLMYIARNCADSIFTVLDTGKKRSAADVVSIMGMKSASHVASTARLIFAHQNGGLMQVSSKKRISSNADVLAICSEIDLSAIITRSATLYSKSRILNVPEYAYLLWLLSQRHTEDADAFLLSLASGVGLEEGSPILMLRRKLESARMGERFNFTPIERIGLTIKAWNLLRLNKVASMLTFNIQKDTFPVPA